MNVSKYTMSEEMARDAVLSLTHMPSIAESIRNADSNVKSEENAEDETLAAETLVAEVDGVRYEYTVASDSTACIAKCPDDPRVLDIPSTLEGHTVTAIGPHAFCTCYKLERATMPNTLAEIGEYAFMNTALEEFTAPNSLQAVEKNAFYKCVRLARVALNEGLREIGENAFRESALEELDIPESVIFVGHNAFKSTHITFDGNDAALRIAPGNERYRLDGGTLYALGKGGAALMQVLDENLIEFETDLPTVAVAAKAFAGLKHLKRVTLPDGTRTVGNEAFKGCTELEHVELPDSIERIGSRAFMDTKLASLRIPAALETIGVAAFYTGGSIARDFERTIERIEIAPGNETFYLVDGMLCQLRPDEGDLVVLYAGHEDSVTLPIGASAVGAYAFLNASNVRKLQIHDGIEGIDVGGLDLGQAAPTVIYDVVGDERHAGERYVISYPPGQAGRQAARQAFSRGYFDLEYAFAGADNAILTTRDVYIRAKGMLERLRNPVMLHANMRKSFEKALKSNLDGIVVAFGRNGFARGIDWLHELGMLNGETIDSAIEAASDAGEIAVLSRLVELRRTAFAAPLFDFDL